MLIRVLSAVALLSISTLGFIACNNDKTVPAPAPTHSDTTSLSYDDEELPDDLPDEDSTDANGRAAAIDTAVAVKWQIKLTSACNGTASVGFKYVEGSQTTTPLSASATTSALGFKTFSIPAAKVGTVLLKTFDKTKAYSIYIKVPAVKKTESTAAVPAYYKYLTGLSANPAAEKALNKAGTKRVGRPITTTVKELACQ